MCVGIDIRDMQQAASAAWSGCGTHAVCTQTAVCVVVERWLQYVLAVAQCRMKTLYSHMPGVAIASPRQQRTPCQLLWDVFSHSLDAHHPCTQPNDAPF